MITEAHVQECLSKAYLQAIIARAGMTVHFRDVDYGVDGTFCDVRITRGRRAETGFAINFQGKATVNWKIDEDKILYDLDVKNYNDLARMSRTPGTVPSILALFCMPADPGKWLEISEEELLMRKCAYWMKIDGEDSTNTSKQRVAVPQKNLLGPEAVVDLMKRVREGNF